MGSRDEGSPERGVRARLSQRLSGKKGKKEKSMRRVSSREQAVAWEGTSTLPGFGIRLGGGRVFA